MPEYFVTYGGMIFTVSQTPWLSQKRSILLLVWRSRPPCLNQALKMKMPRKTRSTNFRWISMFIEEGDPRIDVIRTQSKAILSGEEELLMHLSEEGYSGGVINYFMKYI